MHNTHIGGIALNFRMPDVMALAIGGGTYVKENPLKIGPQSCGRNLMRESQIFGGPSLTLTDVACRAECMEIPEGDLNRVAVGAERAKAIMEEVSCRLQNSLKVMRGERADLPVVIVGGGAGIGSYKKEGNTIIPELSGVANAYGAALAEISATVDTVVSLKERKKTLEELKEKAVALAIGKGADAKTARIVDVQVIPYHYIPNNLARVIVIASCNQT
jgi:N-methylhydantoinase A/oxoprolinase/acetone carboxylase beta subunit